MLLLTIDWSASYSEAQMSFWDPMTEERVHTVSCKREDMARNVEDVKIRFNKDVYSLNHHTGFTKQTK